MNDPTTIQAEADARIDHYREALNKQARDLAALRVENQHLRTQVDDLRRMPTQPAPPCTEWPCAESLPSPRNALPTIEWDASAVENPLPEEP